MLFQPGGGVGEGRLLVCVRVLELNTDAAEYLRGLARQQGEAAVQDTEVCPHLVRLMEEWESTPALVLGSCLDVVAANALGRALYSVVVPYGNLVRFTFLDQTARTFYRDWKDIAEAGVAWLRSTAGASPDNPRLNDLVDELSGNVEFHRLWRQFNVEAKSSDAKRLCHPVEGDVTLTYQIFDVNGAPGQHLFTYQAEPGSPSEEALVRLRNLHVAG